MNTFRIYIISIVIILSCDQSCAQNYSYKNFYIGLGTGVSSYLGGYFGNAYSMKVLSDYSDDYYDDDYYYNYNYNYDYYDDYNTTIWSPLQFEILAGFSLTENFSAEFSSNFIFAFDGHIDPEFVTGNTGKRDYLDRNTYSQLYAVPVSATLKIHSSSEDGNDVFLKFGPAFQYTSEEYDRIREYYDYSSYYSYSEFYYLYTVSKSEWLPGFTVSTGLEINFGGTTSQTELSYSYFKISGDNSTALALDRAPEAQLFALNTKIFFNF